MARITARIAARIRASGLRRHGIAVALATGLAMASPVAAEERPDPTSEKREACSAHDPLRRPLFGDTHVHTAFSFDAASQNTRGTPRDAYRFARGEEIGLQPYTPAGKALRTVRIDRPLDWTAITDHAEMLGEVRSCLTEGQPGHDSDACWYFRALGPLGMITASRVLIDRDRFQFCGKDGQLCRGTAQAAWRQCRS